MTPRCPRCGAQVDPHMKFCGECGAKLDFSQSTVSYSPVFGEDDEALSGLESGRPPANRAALIELDQVEGTAGRRMHDIVDEGVTVGRSPSSDIFLDDVTVSREHARVVRSEKGFRIQDIGSLNGTYVNRVRVDAVDLRNGDEIQIGKYRFKFAVS